jgi:hypothetical protein
MNEEAVVVLLSSQELLGEGRALVRRIRLLSQDDEPALVPFLSKGLRRRRRGQPGPHHHDRIGHPGRVSLAVALGSPAGVE